MADFLINVIVNPSGAVTGARQVENSLDRVNRTANRTQQLLNRALLLAGAAAGIRTLANFSQAMSSVAAISGATDTQLSQLNQTARELGATTRFTATDAAEGLLFLSRAGFEVNESLEAIGGTLTLAQAGALSLGRAADIASNVLKGFRLEADQANDIVDVMAFTANRANTSVEQLGNAMSFVAPVAAGVGVDVRETAAAIAALSDAGIQGERAGTGLRRVLAELESPGTAAIQIFRQLGVEAQEVQVSQVGLTAALQRLAEAGVTTGQALEIFGQRGGPAFEVLRASIGDVQAMNLALQDTEGFAAEVARVMDDNLNGAILQFRSALEAVILSLGEAFLTDALTVSFQALAQALRFTADNVEILIGLLGALSLKAIPAAISAAGRMAVAVFAMLGPIGLIAAAIGLAVGALVAFADQIVFTSDGFVTLQTVAQAVMEEFPALVAAALDFAREQFARLSNLWHEEFIPALTDVLEALGLFLPTFEQVLSGGRDYINRLIGLHVGMARVIVLLVQRIAQGFTELFEFVFGTTIPQAIRATVEFASDAIDFIQDSVSRTLEIIGIGAAQVRAELEGTPFELPDFSIPQSLKNLGADVRDEFLAGFNADYVGAVGSIVEEPFRRVIERARELGREAGTGVAGGVTELPDIPTNAPPALTSPGTDSQFTQVLAQLRQEGELLQLNSRERERRLEILRIEEELGRSLTPQQLAQVDGLLQQNQQLADQASLYEQIRGPQDQVLAQMAALNELFREGRISVEEYNRVMRELQLTALEVDRSLSGGVQRALLQLDAQLGDSSKQVEDLLIGTFNRAADAIAEFATTGKLDVRSLVDSVIQDLIRLAAQKALLSIFSGGFGGLGGGVTAGGGGGGGGFFSNLFGAQNGADFRVGGSGGTDSQLVAFRATPNERVIVQTPQQQKNNGSNGGLVVSPTFILPPNFEPTRLAETEAQLGASTFSAANRAFQRNR